MKTKYETEQKEARINLLELEEKENKQQIRIQRLIILLALVLVLSIVSLGFLVSRTNKIRQREKDLRMSHKILRMQIDPHFFFNILQSFQAQLIKYKSDKALIQQLSVFAKLMRKILNYSTEERVSLGEELEMLEDYIQTHQIRQSIRIDYNIIIAEEVNKDDLFIPPLITQPIVENAIKHGFNGLDAGEITLKVYLSGENLCIEIEDNGVGIDLDNMNFGSKGLSIIQERLELLKNTSRKATLTFASLQPGSDRKGTIVKLALPNDY